MLKLQNIDVTLSKNTKLQRQVLNGINLDVANGEFVVIIGGNGAGKSTIFNVISGYLAPDNGNIIIDNQDVTKTTQHFRSAIVSTVMQDPKIGTMENMSIFENLAFAYKRGKSRAFQTYNKSSYIKLFKDKLQLLGMGLENRLDELVCNLSGGQRQALSLIMAIIANSKILLLDEIAAALDPKTAESVMQIAAKIVTEQKRTTIMITHNMHHAIQYGDRTLLLRDGIIVKKFNAKDKAKLSPLQLAAEFGEI